MARRRKKPERVVVRTGKEAEEFPFFFRYRPAPKPQRKKRQAGILWLNGKVKRKKRKKKKSSY